MARSAPVDGTVADPEAEADDGDARKLSTVGRYVILESIGMGGMGVVCAAYDPKLDRRVALKLLRASSGPASETGRNRLFREAQALAKLTHPNVVTVHDVGDFEGQVYIAMEFVEGTTLREWLREQPRSWQEIVDKFVLAGRGLAAAHAAGIIHRDFKPANVLISRRGDVRVADFGVAKERDRGSRSERDVVGPRRRLEDSSDSFETTGEFALIEEMQSSADKQLTVAGRMVGTPAYMAPEQLMGLKVGPFTDQYSFCVSFYEALYGKLPFEGGDRAERLRRMTEGKPPAPPKDERARSVPTWIYKILARGLRPQATERWPSMDALLQALERDPVRRVRRWALASAFVVTLASVGAMLALGLDEPPPTVGPCQGVGDAIDEHWNQQRAADIRAAFNRSDKPFAQDSGGAVEAILGNWAEDWRTQRVEICEATRVRGVQSDQLLDVRMHCLDERLSDFDALVDVFTEADAEVVERSVLAADGLASPNTCALAQADEGPELPGDPGAREALQRLDKDLSRAAALVAGGKFPKALPELERIRDEARELRFRRTLVESLYTLAEAQFATGNREGCEASLREALREGALLDDPVQEARNWLQLIFLVGYEQHRPTEGSAWVVAADAAILRAGDSPELRMMLENSIASMLGDRGEIDDALVHYARSLQLARKAFGEGHSQTLKLMANYAVALVRAGRSTEGEAMLGEVLSRTIQLLGRSHPQVAAIQLNLGNVQQMLKKYNAAEESLSAALELFEELYGEESLQGAKALNALGGIAREQGRYEDAIADHDRSIAIFRKLKGERSSEVAINYVNKGRALTKIARYDEAAASFDATEDIYEVLHPPDHRDYANLAQFRCDLFLAQSRWNEAEEQCEDAIARCEQLGPNAPGGVLEDSLENLIEIEEGRGRPSAAERARERLRIAKAKSAALSD